MTSLSLTLARVAGYKLMHPEKFKNISYLPSIPDLLYQTKKYLKEQARKSKKRKRGELSATCAILYSEFQPNRWGATRHHPEELKLASLDNLLDATAKYIRNLPAKESKKKNYSKSL